jgi:Zn-finger nucleic acid-binding protein
VIKIKKIGKTKRYGRRMRTIYEKNNKQYVRMFGHFYETLESYYKRKKKRK